MANATIRIENDNVLENITKKRIKTLNIAIIRFLPHGTENIEHLARYGNYDELGGAMAEAHGFDYIKSGKKLGFVHVRNVGYSIGMLNMSLPENSLDRLLGYLEGKDKFWYEILGGDSYRKAA